MLHAKYFELNIIKYEQYIRRGVLLGVSLREKGRDGVFENKEGGGLQEVEVKSPPLIFFLETELGNSL